jgi:uncharacterized protein
MTPFVVRVGFDEDLAFFLRSKGPVLERRLSERTSVKDVIESCGVPHPEVDLILVDGRPVDFGFVLENSAMVAAYSIAGSRLTFFPEHHLQVNEMEKFVADGHLGKLTRDLRLLGFDVAYDPSANDRQLLTIATTENRALLTRDRRLLMHAVLRTGYYMRSQNSLQQTLEVVRRFQLAGKLAPFSRCLRCNERLENVTKTEILDRLEPLTKIYYEQFHRCAGCGQIYWPGSHFEKLETRIAKLQQRL